jgi:hypothetical protein
MDFLDPPFSVVMPSSAHLLRFPRHKESAAWRKTRNKPSTLLRIRSMLTDGKRKAKGLLLYRVK